MLIELQPLTPVFAAEVNGVDLVSGLNDELFAAIRRAFEEYSILVFRDQPMDDDQQIAFSKRFGRLETTVISNPAGGTPFARQSNIDINTGELISPDDRRMAYQKGNMLWHADSTFKETASLCSILTAREVPPEGGATEFASTRAAFEVLDGVRGAEIEKLIVEHSVLYSRSTIGFTFTEEEAAQTPPVAHPLVRTNPVTGRKSVMIGAHASHIVGWPVDRGRALLKELLELATQPKHQYRHEWTTDDLVIWDNRATLHRATAYDTSRFRRLMQRTTVADVAA